MGVPQKLLWCAVLAANKQLPLLHLASTPHAPPSQPGAATDVQQCGALRRAV